MKNLPRFSARVALLAASLLATAPAAFSADKPATLKDAFKDYFAMGVAINQNQFTGKDTNGMALIVAQYNAISPENVMKWQVIHPRPGAEGYDFKAADAYVEFGEKHHLLIVGHTLAWHNQTPAWVFRADDGRSLEGTNEADRQILLGRLHEHIQTVVGRYKGRIKVWDVVNEALNDSSSEADTEVLRRQSPWVRILGQEFIEKAFQWAHEADPDCILRYNDYSIENGPKRKRLITLIKSLQAKNIPVMAIGSQTHANLVWPGVELEDEALTDIASLGLPIHITELDVNASAAGQRNQSADVAQNSHAGGGAVSSAEQKGAEQYGRLFSVFLKHRKDIKLVTLWGLTDRDSWRGVNAKALLFDGNWQPKPAFESVINETKSAGAAK